MNKPVAWIKQGRLGFPVLEFDTPFRYESYSVKNPPIPLYTHPVKELTDEEIDFVFFDLPSGHSIQEFARAILRKAQEK